MSDDEKIKQAFKHEDGKENPQQDRTFTGDLSNIDDYIRYTELLLKKKNEDSERTLREKNAEKAFAFSVCWAIFIAVLILVKGWKLQFLCFGEAFELTETEFIAITTTLTISVLGYYLAVLNYLFPKK